MLRRRQRIILNRDSLTRVHWKAHQTWRLTNTESQRRDQRKTKENLPTHMRTHFKPEIKKSKVSIQKHEAHSEQRFKQNKNKNREKTSRNVLIWNLLLLLSMKITPPSKVKQTNKSENKRTQDYKKSENMKRTLLSTYSECNWPHQTPFRYLPFCQTTHTHTNTDTTHATHSHKWVNNKQNRKTKSNGAHDPL